ncbi:MAG: SRPBCC family protein [Gemmatimonadetes bacterium]|nr:SRPBCC family protein [Gemmatimonadota bacterium]
MKELYAEIDIEASAERVWQVLTDFAAYPEWNPFMRSISGTLEQGGGSGCGCSRRTADP